MASLTRVAKDRSDGKGDPLKSAGVFFGRVAVAAQGCDLRVLCLAVNLLAKLPC